MAATRRRPGPELPYRPIAGAVPCPRGWLVASGKLQGIMLALDELVVVPTFARVVDIRPEFEVLAVHAPIGLLDNPVPGGRRCERLARKLLGQPRAGAVLSAPVRPALAAETWEEAAARNGGMNASQWALLGRVGQVAAEMQPFRQRTVYEVHPELSFYQLNHDAPTRYAKSTEEGRTERQALLEAHLPGVERQLGRLPRGAREEHALDAIASLWTARRIVARSIVRLPEDPDWDAQGLRMEMVR